MTDNEIVKALECCVNTVYTCDDCPYVYEKHYDNNGFEEMSNGMSYDQKGCNEWLLMDCLDLINRQKVTIEQLQTALFKCGEERVTARAEAVKEFAERLKEKIRDVAKIEFQDGYYYLIGVPLIDNLVKEFTEGG